jgi:hypothetical protein
MLGHEYVIGECSRTHSEVSSHRQADEGADGLD